MPMNISDGKLTITAAYGMTVPGAAAYSSQNARLGVELEFPVTGEYEAITEKAHKLEAALTTELKLAVFGQLGLGVTENPDGSIAPDFGTLPVQQQQSAPSGGGGSERSTNTSFGPTKAQKAGVEIPTYEVELDGRRVKVQDRRDLVGTVYSDKAAEFTVDGESVWMLNKDKTVNPLALQIVEAIAPYVPFGKEATPTPM